jgi:beta-aspartyl-peptidase (threonine type)
MEGSERRFGAVGCVTRTFNPVVLARALSRDGDFGRFVVGPAADALVGRVGAAPCLPAELITTQALDVWKKRAPSARAADTVGAVARDADGRVAAAVSTGGLSHKPPGRVGDSAVAGAGFWAEQPLGACVTTGIGEAMLREGTARRCVRLLADGATPDEAAERALAELASGDLRPAAGLILVTGDGRIAIAHTSPEMIAGYAQIGAPAVIRARW